MMQAQELYSSLTSRGFTLTAANHSLLVSPGAALTPADAAAIRSQKPALLEILGVVFSKPYLDESGDLRIPFDSHPRYHYWAGGQGLVETLAELNAPLDTWRMYIAYGFHLLTPKHGEVCKGKVETIGAVCYCAECGYFAEDSK